MSNKGNILVGIVGCCVGLLGVGYAIGTKKKLNDISDKIGASLDQLSDATEVDIPEWMIDKAVEKAVDREVTYSVKKAVDSAVNEVKRDIHREVKESVKAAYADTKSEVTKELKKQVSNVDISEARKEVVAEAKKEAAEKFDSNLEEILEKFNSDLENVSKIYKSITNAITKESNKNVTFSLT